MLWVESSTPPNLGEKQQDVGVVAAPVRPGPLPVDEDPKAEELFAGSSDFGRGAFGSRTLKNDAWRPVGGGGKGGREAGNILEEGGRTRTRERMSRAGGEGEAGGKRDEGTREKGGGGLGWRGRRRGEACERNLAAPLA